MANSFDEKYKANIAGLAKANNVDMSVGKVKEIRKIHSAALKTAQADYLKRK